jgi:hypothetical protein
MIPLFSRPCLSRNFSSAPSYYQTERSAAPYHLQTSIIKEQGQGEISVVKTNIRLVAEQLRADLAGYRYGLALLLCAFP